MYHIPENENEVQLQNPYFPLQPMLGKFGDRRYLIIWRVYKDVLLKELAMKISICYKYRLEF